MFDVDVGQDLRAGTHTFAVAERFVGVAFDETLVGEHGAGVDVYADEISGAGGAQGECGAGVVAEDVEAER